MRSVLAALLCAGVALRLGLVFASGLSELQSDEANYAYLGLTQQRFGVLLDPYRYLWPPFYPWLLGEALARFGPTGGLVVQVLQALASSAIGGATLLLAWRLGSARAAVVAAALWAVHLPLGGYTHLLWAETFFLALFTPALERLVAALQCADPARAERRLCAAGILFGASLWVKPFALYLVPLFVLIVGVARARRAGLHSAARGATLLALSAAVVVLPWALRNAEVYGRFVPSGATLGENAYIGVNARYMNFDYVALRRTRALRGEAPLEDLALPMLVDAPLEQGVPSAGWPRADDVPHTVLRQDVEVARALDYARAHPGWFARTRLKHLADLVTPLSYTTRHAALGLYGEGALGRAGARHAFVAASLLSSIAVLLLAAAGLARGLRSVAGALVVLPVLAYVGASSLLLSMSRLRLPAEPLLLVLAALALVHGLEPLRERRRERAAWMVAAALVVALVALWLINAREVSAALADAFRGGAA